MKVMVIGNGGREHALCWKLAQSPVLDRLICTPGSPGIDSVAETLSIPVTETAAIVDRAVEDDVDLVVVGPELPLTLGLADRLRDRGIAVFGPGAAGAELEGSKVFSKQFMERHGIPTARFEVTRDEAGTRRAVERFGLPVVLKADGLAAGKGVLIPTDEEELEAALETFFGERRFGAAGDRLVVEECLTGEEVSMIGITDGHRVLPFATSKDYKRIGEDDTGPNTGGMGAHSPSGILTDAEADEVARTILEPTVAGMAAEDRPLNGVLYAGLMMTTDGPRVLEYNVRFGDPEIQPLLYRLEGDLLPVLAAGARGDFGEHTVEFSNEATACVVLASRGYPGTPAKGDVIEGLEEAAEEPGVVVFHAGTTSRNGDVVATGGRVLNVCGRGADLAAALEAAYRGSDRIRWASKVFRRDIGRRVTGC